MTNLDLFYIWLYLLAMAISHDAMRIAYAPRGLRLRRLYLFLPSTLIRERKRMKGKADAQAQR